MDSHGKKKERASGRARGRRLNQHNGVQNNQLTKNTANDNKANGNISETARNVSSLNAGAVSHPSNSTASPDASCIKQNGVQNGHSNNHSNGYTGPSAPRTPNIQTNPGGKSWAQIAAVKKPITSNGQNIVNNLSQLPTDPSTGENAQNSASQLSTHVQINNGEQMLSDQHSLPMHESNNARNERSQSLALPPLLRDNDPSTYAPVDRQSQGTNVLPSSNEPNSNNIGVTAISADEIITNGLSNLHIIEEPTHAFAYGTVSGLANKTNLPTDASRSTMDDVDSRSVNRIRTNCDTPNGIVHSPTLHTANKPNGKAITGNKTHSACVNNPTAISNNSANERCLISHNGSVPSPTGVWARTRQAQCDSNGHTKPKSISSNSYALKCASSNGRVEADTVKVDWSATWRKLMEEKSRKINKLAENVNRIVLITNHLPVIAKKPEASYHIYHVEFSPKVEDKSRRCRIIKQELLLTFQGKRPIYNGDAILYVQCRFEQEENKVKVEEIEVTLKRLNVLDFNSPEGITLCNEQLKLFEEQEMKRTRLRDSFCNASQPIKSFRKEHKLDVLEGVHAAIGNSYDVGTSLEIDISHKVLRVENALNVITNNGISKTRMDNASCLIGQIVVTRHNNRSYRVTDIDFSMSPLSTFERHGTEITFADYFYQTYTGVSIADLKQPLLVIKQRGKRAIYLPPELCSMTGLTDLMRKDFNLMKQIHQITRLGPKTRFDKLQKEAKSFHRSNENWNMGISDQFLRVSSHILNTTVQLSKGKEVPSGANGWSKEMKGALPKVLVPLRNWVILCTERDKPLAEELRRYATTRYKPSFPDPTIMVLPNERPKQNLSYELRNKVGTKYDMVAVILPANREDCYKAVKNILCSETPVPSQVVLANTLDKRRNIPTILTNIMNQMQAKLGAELWRIKLPDWERTPMIMGLDTFHDQSGTRINQQLCSVVACVSTRNKALNLVYSQESLQQRDLEIIESSTIEKFTKNALKCYHDNNGALPSEVIIYRDGVSDGELDMVKEEEVKAVKRVVEHMNTEMNSDICFVYIIAKKGIHTRFFRPLKDGSVDNPCSGTVVDNTVTRDGWMDFFLVSQSVNHGTVSPTHYSVIYNNTGINIKDIQKLTYLQCHLYYNWPGPISLPAVVKLADRLAIFQGQYLRKPFDKKLALLPFYY